MPCRTSMLVALAAAGSCALSSTAFLVPPPPTMRTALMMKADQQQELSSRRQALSTGFAAIVAGVALTRVPLVSLAEEEEASVATSGGPQEVPLIRSKMGGLLEPYSDIPKVRVRDIGLKLLKPSGWNEFQGSPETYVVKWEDIINKDEAVMLNATPVKSTTTSVAALGEVKEVGAKLAKTRGSELLSATDRVTEGFTYYEFEFKGDKSSEFLELVVGKGRLWSLTATAANKRWAKRRELYKNILGSFVPKL